MTYIIFKRLDQLPFLSHIFHYIQSLPPTYEYAYTSSYHVLAVFNNTSCIIFHVHYLPIQVIHRLLSHTFLYPIMHTQNHHASFLITSTTYIFISYVYVHVAHTLSFPFIYTSQYTYYFHTYTFHIDIQHIFHIQITYYTTYFPYAFYLL